MKLTKFQPSTGSYPSLGRRVVAFTVSALCLMAAPAVFAQAVSQAPAAREGATYRPVPAAASDQAQVVLFRAAAPNVGGRARAAHVYVNGEFHTALQPNEFTRMCLAGGDHTIETYIGDAPTYTGKAKPQTSVHLANGSTYFAAVSEQGVPHPQPYYRGDAERLLQGAREQRAVISRASSVKPCVDGPQIPAAPAAAPTARPEKKSFSLSSDTLFAFGKADDASITSKGRQELRRIAESINEGSAETRVTVRGHADPIGDVNTNLRLSQQRAYTVRNALAAEGVSSERIVAVGMGSAEPVATCPPRGSREAQIACNAPNRRVEVIVQGVK